jgi:excisionase family DNA binding protein
MTEPELTVEEVATNLRLSQQTVRRWLRRGDFPNAYRLGGTKAGWRIPQADVEALKKRPRDMTHATCKAPTDRHQSIGGI